MTARALLPTVCLIAALGWAARGARGGRDDDGRRKGRKREPHDPAADADRRRRGRCGGGPRWGGRGPRRLEGRGGGPGWGGRVGGAWWWGLGPPTSWAAGTTARLPRGAVVASRSRSAPRA